jgi:hypothetical protein
MKGGDDEGVDIEDESGASAKGKAPKEKDSE